MTYLHIYFCVVSIMNTEARLKSTTAFANFAVKCHRVIIIIIIISNN
jgi:hypothetical protein